MIGGRGQLLRELSTCGAVDGHPSRGIDDRGGACRACRRRGVPGTHLQKAGGLLDPGVGISGL
jgi:hypothetical protein